MDAYHKNKNKVEPNLQFDTRDYIHILHKLLLYSANKYPMYKYCNTPI